METYEHDGLIFKIKFFIKTHHKSLERKQVFLSFLTAPFSYLEQGSLTKNDSAANSNMYLCLPCPQIKVQM